MGKYAVVQFLQLPCPYEAGCFVACHRRCLWSVLRESRDNPPLTLAPRRHLWPTKPQSPLGPSDPKPKIYRTRPVPGTPSSSEQSAAFSTRPSRDFQPPKHRVALTQCASATSSAAPIPSPTPPARPFSHEVAVALDIALPADIHGLARPGRTAPPKTHSRFSSRYGRRTSFFVE
jgi:hypothetical protein